MADVLADAVSAAFTAVSSALPGIVYTMTAGLDEASVIACSSSDAAQPLADSSGVREQRRVVAKHADFTGLEIYDPVSLDGEARIITSLKDTAGAAWFVGLSAPLEPASVEVDGTRGTVMCAYDDEEEPSSSVGSNFAGVVGQDFPVFIPKGEWTFKDAPQFGLILDFGDFAATVQSCSAAGACWHCRCVKDMRGGLPQ